MHCQKVLKVPESIPYLSVGFGVDADFTQMSIMLPNGISIGKPFKITRSSPQSRELTTSKVREAQEMCSLESHCFPESTGVYHIPLLCLPRDKGLDCAVISPIVTENNTDVNVGKLHDDKFDPKKTAKVGPDVSLKASTVPDNTIIDLRDLVRDYYYFEDPQSAVVPKLHAELKMSFPAYLNTFSEVTTQTSLKLLETYPLVVGMLAAPKDESVGTIRSTVCLGETYTLARYDVMYTVAKDAATFGRALPSNALRIKLYIEMYREYQAHLGSILEELRQAIGKLGGAPDYDRTPFVQTPHGVGFLSAIILIAEMGSFDLFSLSKKLYTYLGLGPGVNDSDKFHGDGVHMPERGSSLTRCILHMAAVNNLKVDKTTKTPMNLVIYDYYTRKCVNREESITVGAVMHKIHSIIFAMLRNNKSPEPITSEEHRERYAAEHPESVNPAT